MYVVLSGMCLPMHVFLWNICIFKVVNSINTEIYKYGIGQCAYLYLLAFWKNLPDDDRL